jgi:hypothetical protein
MQIPVLGLIGVVEDEENLSMWAELADRPLDPKVSIDGVRRETTTTTFGGGASWLTYLVDWLRDTNRCGKPLQRTSDPAAR